MPDSAAAAEPQYRVWTKDEYFISTDPSLIDATTLNRWFASEDMYWTNPLPDEVMRMTLRNSTCFGLYKRHESTPSPAAPRDSQLVGLARCVTDHVTIVYLTDVYVLAQHRGGGLGSWLIQCVREHIDSMPYLRQSLLLTSDRVKSVPFYEKLMGMNVHQSPQKSSEEQPWGQALLIRRGKAHPLYEPEDTS